jgi:hypothetical protein
MGVQGVAEDTRRSGFCFAGDWTYHRRLCELVYWLRMGASNEWYPTFADRKVIRQTS